MDNQDQARLNWFKILKRIGYEYYKIKNYIRALEAYQKALEIDPNNAEVLNGIGRVYYASNETAQALNYFQQALAAAPDLTSENVCYYNIGLTFEKMSQYEEAMQAYEQALIRSPDDQKTQHRKAVLLSKLKKEG